ncbi:acyltransferase [Clostridium tertium]|uniref:acyltransferase n=1 Tax=Clostridium tertium TaxID=1559 RepID=UPI001AE7C2B5|nr:acyltransferase family protein [Clostridium tertium]MBP1870110.1 surface polysaccharide O-acyltransferase-like enzyme [Clostridium tertium]
MFTNNRIISADILRILSAFLVVILHVSGLIWTIIDINSVNWAIINIYNSIARCCVQIFIMLSGMFILSPKKNITTRNIYTKYLPRMVVALLFWSSIYLISFPLNLENIKYIIISILKGQTNYHLWFLYMIIGLYIITPVLRIITSHGNKKQIEYFLIIGAIISVVVPTLSNYFPFNFISENINKMYIFMPRAYILYFLLGFYLTNYDLKKTTKKLIYFLGLSGLLFTIVVTQYSSLKYSKPIDSWQGIFTINMFFYSIGIFLFLKDIFDKIKFTDRKIKFISILSSCSFGVFLMHDLFIKFFTRIGILTTSIKYPVITVPIVSIIIFIVCIIISYFIKKIPVLKKYII